MSEAQEAADPIDQAVLLEALSASGVALFEAHYCEDSPDGARMFALLKALDAQVHECTSLIYDWSTEIPRMERQIEEALKPPAPPPASSKAMEKTRARLSASLDRHTAEVEAVADALRAAHERVEGIEDPELRAAELETELERLDSEDVSFDREPALS